MLSLIAFGYLCGGVAATLLVEGSWKPLPSFYQYAASKESDPNVSDVYQKIANTIPVAIIVDTCIVVSVS